MPWQETNPELERHHFAQDLDSGHWTMTECLRSGPVPRSGGSRGWGVRGRGLVVVANPRQVHDFGKATGQLAKTDRIDAGLLALFAERVRPEPSPDPVTLCFRRRRHPPDSRRRSFAWF